MAIVVVMMFAIPGAIMAEDNIREPEDQYGVGNTEISASPLSIAVGKDGSFQVNHEMIPLIPGQVYPSDGKETDAGMFLWFGGIAVGPNPGDHASGSASNEYSPSEAISQSDVLGNGTDNDPWRVETDVSNTSAGASMKTEITYVDGDDLFRVDWEICVSSPGPALAFLAGDNFLQGSDYGYGLFDESSGSVGAYNEAQDWFQVIRPVTPASAHFEGHYSAI